MISGIGGSGGFDIAALQSKIQERTQQKIAQADADNSGGLSIDEFQSSAPRFVSNVQDVFTQIDADSNGELTESEFSAFAESRAPQGGGPLGGGFGGFGGGTGGLASILAAEDEEGASIIEQILGEATSTSEDFFNILDADEDGEVSETELQSSVERLRNEFLNVLLGAQEDAAA